MDATWSPRPQALAARHAGFTAGAPLHLNARSDAPADQPQLGDHSRRGRGDARPLGGRGAREGKRALLAQRLALFFWRVAEMTSAPEPPSPPSPIRP